MKQIARQRSRWTALLSGMLLSCTGMHCVHVVSFVQTLGWSPLRSLGLWVLTFSLCTCKAINQRHAKQMKHAAHIGLDQALCPRCMSLIRAFTRCGAFLVHSFSRLFSSQVRKKGLARACSSNSVRVGLLKPLSFVLRRAVAIHSSLSLVQVRKEEVHDTHNALVA